MSFRNLSRFRPAARLFAVGIGATACVGATATLLRRTPIRFDAPAQPTAASIRQHESPSAHISPSMVEQVSSGSVAGFGTGLVVALFSKSLALIAGLVGGAFHLASRAGLDLFTILGLDKSKFLRESRLYRIWAGKPWFATSFFVTFILAAFVHL